MVIVGNPGFRVRVKEAAKTLMFFRVDLPLKV